MIEIRKKYKLWIVAIAYLAVAGLALVFIVAPLRDRTFKLAENLQRSKVDGEMNQIKIARISETEKQRKYFQEKTSWLDGFLDYNEEMDFIKKLEALSEETGNKIALKIEEPLLKTEKKVTGKTSEEEDDNKKKEDIISTLPYPKYIILRISLQGNYDGLFQFIQKLENFDYYVNITSLQLQRGIADKEESTVLFDPFVANSEETEAVEKKDTLTLKSEISAVVYTRK